ncbi:TlyA family RNA methyltransferase [Chitinimonas koreensis]|uniref:TlyA family RNA methyltransferase n=1 Tax=Chitinimonas koreensis TaxID=356302 RepID=UPI001654B2B9|nr:TlyA family RNA methyltransferase [Chitinimonas koreensis]QNM96974.1 TlyA family RNA methyltransferase [Chitinimonas koreensis]
MTELIRADLLLAQRGLASSRTAAQALIEAGRVTLHEAGAALVLRKPSHKLPPDADLAVAADPADRFVSRGGLKLAGALAHTGLAVDGLHCLDVGISTGGFSDCLLQAGAAVVVGVDVGHGQLHPRLAAEPRLTLFEGVNARALDAATILAANAGQPFDLAVADVSFISLTLVLPAMVPLLRPGGRLLCLVKPQFEVGREGLGKGGIVRDAARYQVVRNKIETTVVELGLQLQDWFDSPIAGGDGNREFFVFAIRP